jgi:reversibly glycosylated polypeptide/UDP-arabinopyranose mutase
MNKIPSVGCVVPTIREKSINEFLEKWDFPDYCKLFIIEDNSQREFTLSKNVYFHGSWKDFEKMKNNWIFSKKCGGGIRSFGFYKAWQDGCDYIITLDDDCLPDENCNGEKFVEEHIKQLEINNGRWLWTTKGIRPRGVPYQNTGREDETMINMGFWKKNADFDAPTQLIHGSIEVPPRMWSPVPKDYYFSLCGMNMCFKAEAIGLMFQPLMGEAYGIWRLDDIWCGVIAKKVCDHLNFLIRTGKPSIIHSRASNIWSNLKKEAIGFESNEEFWEIIDGVQLKGETMEDCYLEIANVLKKREEEYLKVLGVAMEKWIDLF